MSSRRSQESGCYMDAVKVKIAEEYKPPPKINLLMTHTQRLTFNKQIEDNLPKYDFSIEKNVLEKVREWKKNRLQSRRERESRLREAEESEPEEETETSETPGTSEEPNVTSYSNGLLQPTKVIDYYSNILQPVPLNSSSQKFTQKSTAFNISEFEADTSSPFDNVALKSINEVEELAKVLKIEDEKPPQYNFHNVYPNYSVQSFIPSSSSYTINGFYTTPSVQTVSSFPYQCSPPNNYIPPSFYSQESLAKGKEESKSSVVSRGKNVPKPGSNIEDLPNPFEELPKNLQDLSRGISSMGFPLSRVARTCKVIGDDNKKVLDHLLAMSELLDLGFAEDKISEALLLYDNDRDKALDKLIS